MNSSVQSGLSDLISSYLQQSRPVCHYTDAVSVNHLPWLCRGDLLGPSSPLLRAWPQTPPSSPRSPGAHFTSDLQLLGPSRTQTYLPWTLSFT